MATTDLMTTGQLKTPPLMQGDNLSRDEFLRRWELYPGIKRAELIKGVVYMPSPVSKSHGISDIFGGAWLVNYHVATPGTEPGHNTTVLLLDDAPQPDDHLRILPEYGGASWTEGDYVAGAPELVLEICRSSAAYDLHQKLDLYREAKVQECLAILLYEKEIRWHSLKKGKYQVIRPGSDGLWRSRVFPGLWLDGKALLKNDMRTVLDRLQEGIDSSEHQAFVEQLARRKAARERH
jgi:Uma2 family endonuclease